MAFRAPIPGRESFCLRKPRALLKSSQRKIGRLAEALRIHRVVRKEHEQEKGPISIAGSFSSAYGVDYGIERMDSRIYAYGVARGDQHHRDFGGTVAAGVGCGQSKGSVGAVQKQPPQIAIAQFLYVTDFGSYPFSDGDWFSLLRPYGAKIGPDFYYQDTSPLWCPSACYGGPATQHQFLDYGD